MDEVKYVCAICGTEHGHIEERIECETKCLEARKEAEKQKAREDLNKRCAESAKAIEDALTDVDTMIKNHMKDFDMLQLSRNYFYLAYLFGKNLFYL